MLILLNFIFLLTQCPWILATFTFARTVRASVGLGDNDVRMAVYFCFAAINLAIGSWLTLGGEDEEDEEPDKTTDDDLNGRKQAKVFGTWLEMDGIAKPAASQCFEAVQRDS
ncbi:hypothetical protein PV08_09042 [Exophiala spinifera]|uniref:Uncharacterized protein n=1 Tax=Exophiala spinifera TaxID=91928 RepID=A0A0D2AZ73_9EURO|nr:uncharacterized protein PV08_09042 [Exophiala spinifera]KIW11770.1 hypothetical protein PV08_09042 [Exophiala spinifera]